MSSRLSRGRSTPAMRATCASLPLFGPTLETRSALPLLVPRVRADDEDTTAPADHAALVADPLDRRAHLHRLVSSGPSWFLPSLSGPSLLVPVHDAASREVVRRQFHEHPVPRQDPDVVH